MNHFPFIKLLYHQTYALYSVHLWSNLYCINAWRIEVSLKEWHTYMYLYMCKTYEHISPLWLWLLYWCCCSCCRCCWCGLLLGGTSWSTCWSTCCWCCLQVDCGDYQYTYTWSMLHTWAYITHRQTHTHIDTHTDTHTHTHT